ncbi:MAG: VWA domain-containing protein [Acidobacteria bacterium]|nr:MAG: VWA domain-containing protein [Acidobacteriota bacterium]
MGRKESIILAVACALIALPVMMAAYAGQSQKPPDTAVDKPQTPPKNPTLKVDVDLVLVNATVTDPQNRYVTGLEKEHFQIWEDKLEQKIEYFSAEDVPISLGVIFDVSGSMKDKISTARDAAVTFLKTGNPEDEYFLVEFANRPEVAEDFTTDVTRLQNRLIFTPAKGMTAMYDSVYLGLEKLKEGNNPKKALLLITDGEDNRSRYTFSNVKDFVKEQDVQIYGIGIVDNFNSQLGSGHTGRAMVEELSDLTGGRAFFPDSVYDLEDICTKIAVELKNQYVIGYSSTNAAKDGKWRKLRLKINPPKGLPHLNVRSKSGYYAPLADAATTGRN